MSPGDEEREERDERVLCAAHDEIADENLVGLGGRWLVTTRDVQLRNSSREICIDL